MRHISWIFWKLSWAAIKLEDRWPRFKPVADKITGFAITFAVRMGTLRVVPHDGHKTIIR
jgi:hypothetical protein